MSAQVRLLRDGALRLAIASADVSNYCDHVEHNEAVSVASVRLAGEALRVEACTFARGFEMDVLNLYCARLSAIEARNVFSHSGSWDGAHQAQSCRTWRDVQLLQIEHDRAYHPDVLGLSKLEQLRHYALHVAKLAGATARVALMGKPTDDWLAVRVPDMLLFGVKLATVTGEKLPEQLVSLVADDLTVSSA